MVYFFGVVSSSTLLSKLIYIFFLKFHLADHFKTSFSQVLDGLQFFSPLSLKIDYWTKLQYIISKHSFFCRLLLKQRDKEVKRQKYPSERRMNKWKIELDFWPKMHCLKINKTSRLLYYGSTLDYKRNLVSKPISTILPQCSLNT